MPTIRQRIVDAIEARFKTILKTGGYETNIGGNVFVWRPSFLKSGVVAFQPQELPALNFRDTGEPEIQPQSAGIHHHKLKIETDVIHAAGGSTDEEVRKMIADVWKCVGIDRYWTEAATGVRLAFNTEPESDEMAVEQEGSVIGGARITFVVHYRTKSFDPYNFQ